jgi:uncharacterized membrane protein
MRINLLWIQTVDPRTWRWEQVLAGALVLAGVQIRLYQYLGRRSLWLDEAFLAENVISKSPVDLVSTNLHNDQTAPLAWLFAVGSLADVFGPGEYVLRALPFAAGVLTLFVVWRLCAVMLTGLQVPVAVGLVASSPYLIRFSNEFKPHSLDVLVVLLCILLATRVEASDPNRYDAWHGLAQCLHGFRMRQ